MQDWYIAVPKRVTKSDTIWRRVSDLKDEKYDWCVTDGTNPICVEGDLVGYIFHLEACRSPIRLGRDNMRSAINMPTRDGSFIHIYSMTAAHLQSALLKTGCIKEPFEFRL